MGLAQIVQCKELFGCLMSNGKISTCSFMGEINFHKFTLDTNWKEFQNDHICSPKIIIPMRLLLPKFSKLLLYFVVLFNFSNSVCFFIMLQTRERKSVCYTAIPAVCLILGCVSIEKVYYFPVLWNSSDWWEGQDFSFHQGNVLSVSHQTDVVLDIWMLHIIFWLSGLKPAILTIWIGNLFCSSKII